MTQRSIPREATEKLLQEPESEMRYPDCEREFWRKKERRREGGLDSVVKQTEREKKKEKKKQKGC